MKLYEGKVVSEDIKIGIVAARFNEFIVSKLVSGAQDALVRHGVADEDIALAWVPGAFEIPLAARAHGGKRQIRRRHHPGRCDSREPRATTTSYAPRFPRVWRTSPLVLTSP